MAEHHVVCVRWRDAVGEDARVTQDDIDAGKLAPLEIVTVGHLMRQTDAFVVVAQDRYVMQGTQIWRTWITIPRVCIQALFRLAQVPRTEQDDEAIPHAMAKEPEAEEVEADDEESKLRRRLEQAQRDLGDFYKRHPRAARRLDLLTP